MEDGIKLQPTNISIMRYKYGDFFVDTVEYADGRQEAFLSHKDYAISMGMFAVICGGAHEEFLEVVEAALPSHILSYIADVFDDSEEE